MYDERSDKFFEDTSFWKPETINKISIFDDRQQDVKTDVSMAKTVKERMESLDVKAGIKLSFLGGLVKVSGSAKYISDDVAKSSEVNVALNYHTSKFKQYIPLSTPLDQTSYCSVKQFTHAVTSISYGLNAHFVFKKTVKDKSKKTELGGSLSVMIKSIPGISIEGDASLDWKKEEKELFEGVELVMYGDFSPTEVLPTNYEEAVKFYKKLPSMTGKKEDKYQGSAPLLVKLTPIKMLCKVRTTQIHICSKT